MAMSNRAALFAYAPGAGAAYFASVFALGFVFGTLRVLVLEPQLGALAAVLVELPFMLAAAWWICGALVRWLSLPASIASRAVMGAVAFTLLIGAEMGLAALLSGVSPARVLEGWTQAPGLAGLLGQIAFALFPVLHLLGKDRAG